MPSILFSTSCSIKTEPFRLSICIDDDFKELFIGTNDSTLLSANVCGAVSSTINIAHLIRLQFELLSEKKINATTIDNDNIPRTILLNNLLNIKPLTNSSNEPNSSKFYIPRFSSEKIIQNYDLISFEPIQIVLSYVHISESFIWTVKRLQLDMDFEAAHQLSVILTEYLFTLKHRPRRLLVFVNPGCGKGKGSSVYEKNVLPLFEEANINVKTIYTKHANHARDYINEQSLDNYDGLVSVGGDGMFSELCHGLLLKTVQQAKLDINNPNVNLIRPNLRIGVIPAGSTDAIVFSTTGHNDPITSTLQIIVGESVLIDINTVHSERCFVHLMATMVSYGFFGNLIQQSDNWRAFGPFRYDMAGFYEFFRNNSYETELTITQPVENCSPEILIDNVDRHLFDNSAKRQDNQNSLENQTINAIQSPTSLPIKCKGDGSFDVILVKSSWHLDFYRFLRHVADDGRTIDGLSNVERYRATEVIIRPIVTSQTRLSNWACDGEAFIANEHCPLCNGKLHDNAISSEYVMNLLRTSMDKLKLYCLPTALNNIHIENNQLPFAHGAFCNILKVQNYAIKCPRVPAVTGSDIENAIIHEIFLSRPLSHMPNILIVYGGIRLPNYGISIVTEFIDGSSLATALINDKILNLTFEERLDIALGICKGLGELHLAGIVHRDFKPANVLLQVNSTGQGYIPKIADFGVSFLIQTASATAVQKSGGTVGYDALEVANGNTPSFQSDIYALSFTLYELLTVQHPFAGLKDTQIIMKFTIKGERPKDWRIHTVHPTVTVMPNILKNIIEKGWSPEPENRATIGEIICAKLNNIDVLYSLFEINNERLDILVQDSVFTKILNFVRTSSITDDKLNRFCTTILPQIHHSIKKLILETTSIERILLAGDFPYLTSLELVNFGKDTVFRYLKDDSFYQHIFKHQITDLILHNNDECTYEISLKTYARNFYAPIMAFFENLKHLTIVSSSVYEYPFLLLHNFPPTIYFSTTLTVLNINVFVFDDCLCLLDGRLNQLTTFNVQIHFITSPIYMHYNMDELHNLKCFSLTSYNITFDYDELVVPLLRRMTYLEKLTLYLRIRTPNRYIIDGTHLHNEILVHMPKLQIFIFYISTEIYTHRLIPHKSLDDIQQTFTNWKYGQTDCILDNVIGSTITHVYSLPFTFTYLEKITNQFPTIGLNTVTHLYVYDEVSMKHEFFMRINRDCPMLKCFSLKNEMEQSWNCDEFKSDNNLSYSIIEYSHLISLDIAYVNIDYVVQFLLETKTHLPCLTELKIKYNQLKTVTMNFTRNTTRRNCSKVERLIIEESRQFSKDVYQYFPSL
ncbi:unnamed protein product [Rotaria sordida]|uniref:Uncharacterized protein n=1 Tax=Rotaria sordida TaxID=392033 RepID=A0A818YKF0_9BILA|nr:unnamed protein product [Rotaria sordida]